MKTIGAQAFQNNQLTTVGIPNSVETVGNSAFADNTLESLTINNPTRLPDRGPFANNQLKTLTVSMETIPSAAFANQQLTSLTLGAGVKTIESGAFENYALTALSIPDSVESVGASAFANNARSLHYPWAPGPNHRTSRLPRESTHDCQHSGLCDDRRRIPAFADNALISLTLGNSVTIHRRTGILRSANSHLSPSPIRRPFSAKMCLRCPRIDNLIVWRLY